MRVLTSLDTDTIAYRVTATNYDGTAADTSSDPVRVAFVPIGQKPGVTDWHTATWVATGVAGVLVGPRGGIVLAVGSWVVWIDIQDAIEEPVRPVDVLKIT